VKIICVPCCRDTGERNKVCFVVYVIAEMEGQVSVLRVYCPVCLIAEIEGKGTVIVVYCDFTYLFVLYIRRRFNF
jgi:hypothetical protein